MTIAVGDLLSLVAAFRGFIADEAANRDEEFRLAVRSALKVFFFEERTLQALKAGLIDEFHAAAAIMVGTGDSVWQARQVLTDLIQRPELSIDARDRLQLVLWQKMSFRDQISEALLSGDSVASTELIDQIVEFNSAIKQLDADLGGTFLGR